MSRSPSDLPFTPRERLRWQRAKDERLIDAIFGSVVRDAQAIRDAGIPAALLCGRLPMMQGAAAH